MKIIDANVILRYLLNDVEEMTEEATEIIENSTVQVLNEVLAEVVYVLEDKLVMINALNKYREIKLDFVDCLLYAYSKHEQVEIFTFDKKLNKEIESEADSFE